MTIAFSSKCLHLFHKTHCTLSKSLFIDAKNNGFTLLRGNCGNTKRTTLNVMKGVIKTRSSSFKYVLNVKKAVMLSGTVLEL